MTKETANLQYFFSDDTSTDKITLRDEEAHHCRAVLRKKPGDRIFVVDGRGTEVCATVTTMDQKHVYCEVEQRSHKPHELLADITLAAALLKKDNFEWVLEKGTELGVNAFVALETERTVAGPSVKKIERWQKIVLAAMKQSQRSVLPTVRHCGSVAALISDCEGYDMKFVLSQAADKPLKAYLLDRAVAQPLRIMVVTGPEGDFTHTELDLGRAGGLQAVHLGQRRLRSETAAISAVSIIAHLI